MNKKATDGFVLAFWITAAVIVVLSGPLYFYFSALPVSGARLAQLKSGMTTNDVTLVLGKPIETRRLSDGDMWIYESYVHFWAVEVFFDSEGHYTNYWRD
jgi:hypothetical protein